MRKNILKTLFAAVTTLTCIFTCGAIGGAKINASAESEVYTQTFTDLTEVQEDFTAYYQTAMGASAMMMEIGDSVDDYCNWYIQDGAINRRELDDDIDQDFDTSSLAILSFTKRTYVNFELTVEYKRSSDTYYWPVVAFRQSEPGQYFLEDGVGVFVQRDGKATMWGGEGVGGPYESGSRGSYTDTAWHTLRLVVDGISVRIYIDGDSNPALSRNLPSNMFRHGYISLTSVNNACSFRNLSIKELAIVEIDQNQTQPPQPESNESDALGNLAERVEDIDELGGLQQEANTQTEPTMPSTSESDENTNDGCSSSLLMVNGLWVLAAGGLVFAKKRQKGEKN